jgi:excisionase family DNA binding protein
MPTEQTFSTQEAADRLQVSVRTIRNMIERGSINAHKVDPTAKSVYRIPAAEIDRILAERENTRNQPGRKQ